MALTLRRYVWRRCLTKLSEWYNAGDRALWRHLRNTFGLESRAQRKLESASAYCRTFRCAKPRWTRSTRAVSIRLATPQPATVESP